MLSIRLINEAARAANLRRRDFQRECNGGDGAKESRRTKTYGVEWVVNLKSGWIAGTPPHISLRPTPECGLGDYIYDGGRVVHDMVVQPRRIGCDVGLTTRVT